MPEAESDAQVTDAVARSRLGEIPEELLRPLLVEGRRVPIPAGESIHAEEESGAHVELVLAGLVRAHVSAPDGRTLTIRYCRPGDVLGVATLFTAGGRPFAVQALTDAEIFRLRSDHMQRLAERDVRVAMALLHETSDRVMGFVAELSRTAFAPVRQRLARHLLDIAEQGDRGTDLVAPFTQQELADAAGTVREVAVRTLREFRAAGLVRTGRHGITLLQAEHLLALAEGAEWNLGS